MPCQPPPDRVLPPQPRIHGDEQAHAHPAGGRGPSWRAGTTRACPPSRGCAAAATRRPPSATSATASASPRPTTWWRWPLLEQRIRDDLDRMRPGAMAVLRPLKVVIENYPEGQREVMAVPNHPKDEDHGDPELTLRPGDLHRPGGLRRGPAQGLQAPGPRRRGAIAQRLRDPLRRGDQGRARGDRGAALPLRTCDTLGRNPEGRKVKGVIHWVSAAHAVRAEVRLYDRLFSHPGPVPPEGGTSRRHQPRLPGGPP